VYRDGKVLMRFIRANKKPKGAMQNYEDGGAYWMYPRHAVLPWWEIVDKVSFPVVDEASPEDSVFEAEVTRLDDEDAEAIVAPSGMTIQPGGRVSGGFREPDQVIVDDTVIEAPALEAPPEEAVEEPPDLGFPVGETPSNKWKKKQLLAFILHKGGYAKSSMKKEWLLQSALSLAN